MFEELAYADGSTGWSAMANVTTSCFAAIYTSDDAAKTMFNADGPGHPRRHARSGRHAPARSTAASSSRVSYQFGCGCAHATWFGAGVQEVDANGERAERRRRACPRCGSCSSARAGRAARQLGRARSRGHRAATTTRSTSSSSPEGSRSRCSPRRPARRRPTTTSACSASSRPGTPASRSGSARVRSTSSSRSCRPSSGWAAPPVADEQLFQHDFAMHDAAMRAAPRLRVRVVRRRRGHRARRVTRCSLVQQQRMRQATTYATRVAADAARFAYTWAGTSGVAQRRRAAALLPRHPRRHPARLRRQQHAHRVHAGAARGIGLEH